MGKKSSNFCFLAYLITIVPLFPCDSLDVQRHRREVQNQAVLKMQCFQIRTDGSKENVCQFGDSLQLNNDGFLNKQVNAMLPNLPLFEEDGDD